MKYLTIIAVLTAGIGIVGAGHAAPKAAAKKIPVSIVVQNDRSVELTQMALAAAGAETVVVASLKKPLPAGKKTSFGVKGLKSCLVSISAVFGDDGSADTEMDICKDKTVRFTD